MPKFYHFRQNNSGGSFSGPAIHVIIEANSENEAVSAAEDVGLYFNGVATGNDCGCCGDRWDTPWEDGTPEPMIYDTPVAQVIEKETLLMDWSTPKIPLIKVYYLDGTEKEYKTH